MTLTCVGITFETSNCRCSLVKFPRSRPMVIWLGEISTSVLRAFPASRLSLGEGFRFCVLGCQQGQKKRLTWESARIIESASRRMARSMNMLTTNRRTTMRTRKRRTTPTILNAFSMSISRLSAYCFGVWGTAMVEVSGCQQIESFQKAFDARDYS